MCDMDLVYSLTLERILQNQVLIPDCKAGGKRWHILIRHSQNISFKSHFRCKTSIEMASSFAVEMALHFHLFLQHNGKRQT
jgi:hypothetical protein